jgi:hypothetical protein
MNFFVSIHNFVVRRIKSYYENFFIDSEIGNPKEESFINHISEEIQDLAPEELEQEAFVEINSLLSNGKHLEALNLLSQKTIEFSGFSKFLGKKIYLPLFDSLITRIWSEISEKSNVQNILKSNHAQKIPVILATELYFEGGHSRIAEEICALFPNALIVLTNSFHGSSREPALPKAIKDLPILVLPEDNVINNILQLNKLCKTLASQIYHLGHHHDVVLNAAVCEIDVPVYFIHHSDHKPSLGNTISKFIHIDIVLHMHEQCSHWLGSECVYWPQGVSDYGVKNFNYPLVDIITSSSGSHTKFDWEGSISYPQIISSILSKGVTSHYHIGSLTDSQLTAIKAELLQNNILIDRFKYIGPVSSLWSTLLELPVNCYIGSAPIHGLRTAIEVQGAGIAILPYKQNKSMPFMLEDKHYNRLALYWSSINDLIDLMPKLRDLHMEASSSSRLFYEENFTVEMMKKAILETSKYEVYSDKL